MAEATLYLIGALCLAGAFVMLVAALGVLRLGDFFTRTHAASKAGSVGASALLLALGIASGDSAVLFRALAGVGFILLTTPVAAHLLGRAAYLAGTRPSADTRHDALAEARRAGAAAAPAGAADTPDGGALPSAAGPSTGPYSA